MEILYIILIIVFIYLIIKSKNKQAKQSGKSNSDFGKITYSVSDSSSGFSRLLNDNGNTNLKINSEVLRYFYFSDSSDKSFRIMWRRKGTYDNESELFSSKFGNVIVLESGSIVFDAYINTSEGVISNRDQSAVISNNGVFAISVSPNIHKPETEIRIGDTKRGFFDHISVSTFAPQLHISDNGIYMIVGANGSPDDGLRNKLIIIDIQKNEIIGKIQRRYYYSDNIQISETERQIHLLYGKDSIVINFNGETINEKYKLKILLDAVVRGELHDLKTAYSLLEEKNNESYAENLTRALSSVNPLDINVAGDDISKAYRLLAEYYENSDIQISLQYYEKALEYNQRAGVKRKIKELQDKINN